MDPTSCQVENSLGLYNQVRDDGGLEQGIFRGGGMKWSDAGCRISSIWASASRASMFFWWIGHECKEKGGVYDDL